MACSPGSRHVLCRPHLHLIPTVRAKHSASWDKKIRIPIIGVAIFFAMCLALSERAVGAIPDLYPPTAAVVDGYPSLVYTDSKGYTTYISFAEYKGEPAFKFAVARYYANGLMPPYLIDGYLLITKTQIIWNPVAKGKHNEQEFQINTGDATCDPREVPLAFQVKGGNTKALFFASFQVGQPHPVDPDEKLGNIQFHRLNPESSQWGFPHWCSLSITSFDEAQHKFHALVGEAIWENSPQMQARHKAERQAFDQQLAAWRAAGSKVDPPEDAQRHFAIAQAAFQDKNFQHQADELAAALEIYPTWPAEQYDLAVILGELDRYSDAIQHMKMYLELAPDAPDVQRAKQQIWIWQDKLGESQSVTAAPAGTEPPPKTQAIKPPTTKPFR